ncbi:hypothetical protein BJY04DRAFT_215993 [Aspergillus karnatakaensis]|uniref:pentatricopeptide repeat protein n=1 Tax=Aspergillus karnatakaensis TaxID=1810916 RepID=UPI003CCD5012
MLRPVVRGARWYQHVARSINPATSPLTCTRSFTAIAPRSYDYGGPNDKVNFFEQDTPRSKRRRRVDLDAEQTEEKEEVDRRLAQLKKELKELEDPFAPDGDFIQSLPEKDKAIALEALRKLEEEGALGEPVNLDAVFDDQLDDIKKDFKQIALEEENWMKQDLEESEESPRQPYEVIFPDSEHDAYVNLFNKSLKGFAGNHSSEKTRQDLWKWYRRCKQVIPRFVDALPEDAMALLWSSQLNGPSTETQAAHIKVIAEDALAVGRTLPTLHILSYIQSLHQLGNTKAALEQWEAHQAGLSQRKEDLEPYWRLGVQLFAADGDPQRAQDIALAFLTNDNSRQPRILIPVITAWGRQPGKQAEVKAWALYLQLKASLEHGITMEDYDQISIELLKSGRLNLAIAVFKDMMVTGQDTANDSTALYKAALGLVGNLQASAISEKEVNKVSLSTLTVLPRRFENRFFYASWMKKLIGMGEVDSAAMVIELMYERGVKPDPKHLNGLISGWLRVGSATAREKAETLGWSMIHQRIERVSQAGSQQAPPQVPDIESTGARIPKFMQRSMPAASIETFSILLLHYTRRGDDDATEKLVENLAPARIQPNSYFMNHLLYAELRKQDIRALWLKFQTLSATVPPDLETYACLWDCGKLQYDRSRTAYLNDFPIARVLYANMITWFSNLSPRAQATARAEFSKELYDQIIRCFCLSRDVPGTIVALSSLHSTFNFTPDDTTARLIILQVARHAAVPSDTPKRRLRRLSSTPKSKENVALIHRLVEIISDRKSDALEAKGLSLGSLDPHETATLQLEIMTDLLRVIMGRVAGTADKHPDPERIEAQLEAVAKEMDVFGINLGPKLGDEGASLLLVQ